MRGVNQKQIAKEVGVSQTTVSMVFNNDPRISETTRNKVFGVIKELDYQPDGIARSFAADRGTNNIGFILCGRMISNPSYLNMMHGIDLAVSRQSKRLLFASTEELVAKKSRFPLILKERVLDGVMVTGVVSTDFIGVLRKRSIPTVLLGSYDIEGVDMVTEDSNKGMFEAASHLIALGHQRIAFMTGSFEHVVHREQLEGYKLAHGEAGLDYDEGLVLVEREEKAASMIQQIFEMPKRRRPTAIVAANDMLAINAMEILKEKGLRIPEDMGMVGFGDIAVGAYTTPRLTTVSIHYEKMAELAVKRLIEIIDDDSQEPVKKKVNTELVIRES